MKLVSFNVNSIRSRLHQLEMLINKHSPEIIGLQETKAQDEDFPLQAINDLGYQAEFFGQKTHYGVALLSKQPAMDVRKGFATDNDDAQRRIIEGSFQLANGKSLRVINGYFPQGESRDHPTKFPAKQKFYADLQTYLQQQSPSEQLMVMGDFNIAPNDMDIGIGEDNAKRWIKSGKTSFLPEEREWFQKLVDWGLQDTYRIKHPNADDLFSWFDYRSRGFDREPRRGLRIDFLMATASLSDKLIDTGIDYEIRSSERPSDHCPVWSEFDLKLKA